MAAGTVLLPLLALTIRSAVSSTSVGQLPQNQNHTAGEKASFYCTFPFVRDSSGVQVRWWKEGERFFLGPDRDSRHTFEIRNKVSAAFYLQDVRASDTGRYYCGVTYDGKSWNGTGSYLLVTAPDQLPRITSTLVRKGSSVSLRLTCTAAESPSQELAIKWFVNGTEVGSGAQRQVQPWPGGLFQVSSSFEDVGPARYGTVYTCRVSYPDNRVQTQVYTYHSSVVESQSAVFPWWIYICLGSGAFLLLLIVTALICVCRPHENPNHSLITNPSSLHQGKRRKDEYRSVQEERTPPSHRMAPRTMDSRSLTKGTNPKNVHRKTQCPHVPPRGQKGFGKVIYAAPQYKERQGCGKSHLNYRT